MTTSTQQVKAATTAAQSEIERLILESDYAGKQVDGDVKMAVATKPNGQVNLSLTLNNSSSRTRAERRSSLWTVRENVTKE